MGLLGGMAFAPIAARAQQPERMRRVGVLMGYPEGDPQAQANVTALRKGLNDAGWVEGRNVRIDFGGIDATHQRSTLVDAAQLVFVKIPAGADVVGGESDRHMGVGHSAADNCRTALRMLALLLRQPKAVGKKRLHQHDHLTAVGRPHSGFGQGQGHMVIGAAFAAAYAGKGRIH